MLISLAFLICASQHELRILLMKPIKNSVLIIKYSSLP